MTGNSRPLISIVVVAYNEEESIPELVRRLTRVFDLEKEYTFECIVVENGSTDTSYDLLKPLPRSDKRFKIIRLSRNFRFDGGLTAGLQFVSGDACVLMAADLQDPPEFIQEFLRLWELGYENIYARVLKREGIRFTRKLNSWLFYKVASRLTAGVVVENVSDFRLVDRKVYEAVRQMSERNRFLRGLFSWVGFKSVAVDIERPARFGGKSNAPFMKVLELAFKGIFAHSTVPLKLFSLVGLSLTAISILFLGYFSLDFFLSGVPFPGYGTLVGLVLFSVGLVSAGLGLIGEYVGLIYEEVKGRPNFIVSELQGLDYPKNSG